MAFDYKNTQIKHLLEDQSVLRLLEAVKEYPMASVDDLTAKIKLVDGETELSSREIRIILSRLEISSQSQRVDNFPKVIKMIQKIKAKKSNEVTNLLPEKEEAAEAAEESAPEEIIPEIPEQPDELQPEAGTESKEPAPQLAETESILKQQSDKVIEELVVRNENSITKSKKNALLPRIKFGTSPIYFVIIFLLLIALIYWLFTTQLYGPDNSLLQDSSLPVSP